MPQSKAPQFRARLRVRFAKALTSDDQSLSFTFAGREVLLKGQAPDQQLKEAKWVVFTAGGFPSEEDAREYGERLKSALDLAGVCTCIGINTGEDAATTWVDEGFARAMGFLKEGERSAPNVHGLSVHPDDDLTRFPLVSATGTVTASPDDLLSALSELRDQPADLGAARAGVRLLNLALMDQHPLSKVVLALSAVEALGQDEKWTPSQAAVIEATANDIERASGGDAERLEVADAIRKSVFRLSVRQGVKRVLARLGLSELQSEWDRLYGRRSSIFHGAIAVSESEAHELANETVNLCGRIVLRLVEAEGWQVPSVARKHYSPVNPASRPHAKPPQG